MPFEKISPPYLKHASVAPVKASVKLRRGQPIVWVSITEHGQEELFGRSIVGARLKVRRGTESHEGLLEISLATKGEHEARAGIKNSASIPIGTWPGVPAGKMTARPCQVVRADHEGMIAVIKLPGLVGEPV